MEKYYYLSWDELSVVNVYEVDWLKCRRNWAHFVRVDTDEINKIRDYWYFSMDEKWKKALYKSIESAIKERQKYLDSLSKLISKI